MHDQKTKCACTSSDPIACKGPTRGALHVAFGAEPCPCPGHAEPMMPAYVPVLDDRPAPHAITFPPVVLRAVQHMLQRAHESGDIGYLIAPFSQTFELLCQAESAITGEPLAAVRERWGKVNPDASPRTLFRREEIFADVNLEAIGRAILGRSQ